MPSGPPHSVSIRFADRPVTWLGLAIAIVAVAPITGLVVCTIAWNATRLPWRECLMWGAGAAIVAATAVILPVQLGAFRGEATGQYRRARRLLRSTDQLAALPDDEICQLILRRHAISPDRLASLRHRHIARIEQRIGRRLPRVWIDEAARQHRPMEPSEQLETSSGAWSLYRMKEYPAGSIQLGPDRLLPLDLAAAALAMGVLLQAPYGRAIALGGVIPYVWLREWWFPQRWWLALRDRDALLVRRRRGAIEREIPLDLEESFIVVTERHVRRRRYLIQTSSERFAYWLILRPQTPGRLAHALLPWDGGPWAGL